VTPTLKRELVDKVERLAAELLAARDDGLFLDRVELGREGAEDVLRVVLDHPDAVTLDHCEAVTRELGARLDEADLISQPYRLEVSSPGVERPLTRDEHFERFRGRQVSLHLYRPIDGLKTVTGRLEGLGAGGAVLVEIPARGRKSIPRELVAKAQLSVDWTRVGRERRGNGGGDGQ